MGLEVLVCLKLKSVVKKLLLIFSTVLGIGNLKNSTSFIFISVPLNN